MATISPEERSVRFNRLVSLLSQVSSTKFSEFDIYRANYKDLGHLSIAADILVPKPESLPHTWPVIVRIHGGFLITGSSLYPAWFSGWILDYAAAHGAVIVSPNYRLLPEATGRDIIQDIEDFWQWLNEGGAQCHLSSAGRKDVELDLDKMLVVGEGAGGYLGIQCALNHPTQIRAMIVAYPMLDLRSTFYTQPFPKTMFGVPNYPSQFVDAFIESSSSITTEADPPVRLDLAMAIVQNGRLLQFLGSHPELFPLERLKAPSPSKGCILPPLFIFHGEGDSAVPYEGTIAFLRKLKNVDPNAKVHLTIRPGDHGFDANSELTDAWLMHGLKFITEAWVG